MKQINLLLLIMVLTSPVNASLIDRNNGLIYDDVLDDSKSREDIKKLYNQMYHLRK